MTGGIKMLFKANGVEWVKGHGRFTGPGALQVEGGEQIRFASAIVATGSYPMRPPIPGLDSPRCIDSTGLLAQTEVPGRLDPHAYAVTKPGSTARSDVTVMATATVPVGGSAGASGTRSTQPAPIGAAGTPMPSRESASRSGVTGANPAEVTSTTDDPPMEPGAQGVAVADAEGAVAAARQDYAAAAARLGASRRAAAARLGPAVEAQLRTLALDKARFEVALSEAREGARGADRVEFLLAANPGEPPKALSRTASGGELSRTMLALHVVLEGAGRGKTMVFDEVDAGVGGAVAAAVGSRLAELARRHQVLCVTHLPQVAAHADRHYHVRKRVSEGRTRTEVVPLEDADRVEELARMLGGVQPSSAARRNAAELLDEAAKMRAGAKVKGTVR